MIRYLIIGILIFTSFIKSNQFIKGVDISMLKQVEENGGLFYENGNHIDPIQLFKDKGLNTARIKIWHTPSLNYNNFFDNVHAIYLQTTAVKVVSEVSVRVRVPIVS